MKVNQEIKQGIRNEKMNEQELDLLSDGLTIPENMAGVGLMILLLAIFL